MQGLQHLAKILFVIKMTKNGGLRGMSYLMEIIIFQKCNFIKLRKILFFKSYVKSILKFSNINLYILLLLNRLLRVYK